MTQIEPDEITEPTLKLCWNMHSIRCAAEVLRAAGLQLMAEDVEAQIPKLAIEEPSQFGSIVRAGYPYLPKGAERPLWQPTPVGGKHYWESETGAVEVWSELTDVEVLRVGLGSEWTTADVAALQQSSFADGMYEGRRDMNTAVHSRLVEQRAEAITSERKNALEKAIQAVEELAP